MLNNNFLLIEALASLEVTGPALEISMKADDNIQFY